MNEYLTLYAVSDFLAYHFISNGKAELDEEKNIVFKINPDKFEESEKKVYNILIAIHKIFLDLSGYAIDVLRKKYQKILNGFENDKNFNEGFMPVFIGLSILERYTLHKNAVKLKIKTKTVRKTIKNIQQAANINLMDKSFLNSLILGERFFNAINQTKEVKCS